jgi:CheY-like chemotaxis protein
MKRQARREVDVLVIEDNPGDVWLIRKAWEEDQGIDRLHVVGDGSSAMAFLRREGRYGEVPRPHLILLDLHLPRKNGLEVLKEIRTDPAIRDLPVIVLSTSDAPPDIVTAYSHGASCYVVKPLDLDDFFAAIQQIKSFWVRAAQLPRPDGH